MMVRLNLSVSSPIRVLWHAGAGVAMMIPPDGK